MRKILISLGACVSPVLSAFVMLSIMASIYAQVQLFTFPTLSFKMSLLASCFLLSPFESLNGPRLCPQALLVLIPVPFSTSLSIGAPPPPTNTLTPNWPTIVTYSGILNWIQRELTPTFALVCHSLQVGYTFFGSDHPDLFGNYTASMLTLVQVLPLSHPLSTLSLLDFTQGHDFQTLCYDHIPLSLRSLPGFFILVSYFESSAQYEVFNFIDIFLGNVLPSTVPVGHSLRSFSFGTITKPSVQ
jgi:hypothetical protein